MIKMTVGPPAPLPPLLVGKSERYHYNLSSFQKISIYCDQTIITLHQVAILSISSKIKERKGAYFEDAKKQSFCALLASQISWAGKKKKEKRSEKKKLEKGGIGDFPVERCLPCTDWFFH